MNIPRFSALLIYYVSASLLVIAGVIKLIDPAVGDILHYVHDHGILSLESVMSIARFQPWAEIVVGGLAFTGWRLEWAAKGIALLYLLFAGIILFVSEGLLTLPLDCGCFGEGEGTAVYLLLVRNLVLSLPLFFITREARRWTLWYRYVDQVQE